MFFFLEGGLDGKGKDLQLLSEVSCWGNPLLHVLYYDEDDDDYVSSIHYG